MDKPLIALSVRQPWPWAMFFIPDELKDVENRTRPTNYRGPLAIHASQGMTGVEYRAASQFIFERADAWPPMPSVLTYGAIVGVVDLVDVVTESDSRWFVGPYGLVLANPRPLSEPVPCKGQLGLWPVPLPIRQQIAAQGVAW